MAVRFATAQDAVTLSREACERHAGSLAINASAIGEPVANVVIDVVSWEQANQEAQAWCKITGHMNPVDTSVTARPINFAIGLPAAWNGRAIQMGGAGMNGIVPNPAGRRPLSDLAKGYVTYGSDSGHAINDNDWALNDEAIGNLGYMQMKKTHDAAMALVETLYGKQPAFNYYVGGSQGGREGLTVAQRYPQDYAGVLATVPIVGLSSLMLGPANIRIREKPLANWVPPVKGNAILAEFMRQCDALDGLADGVINDYYDCRAIFNVNDGQGPREPWKKLHCADDVDPRPDDNSVSACLTRAQIGTLYYIFSNYSPGVALANGRTDFGMWAPSTAVVGRFPAFGNMAPPGALLMARRYQGQEGASDDAPVFFTLGSIGVNGFQMRDLDANPLDYDVKRYRARRTQLSGWLDSTNPNLNAFAAAGHKLIVIVGSDDTIAPSGEQQNYYRSVLDKMGRTKVDTFARFYVLPQTGHGLSGMSAPLDGNGKAVEPTDIPNMVDRFALLTDWVENGEAPGKSVVVTGKSGTRPMCSFPTYPRFNGGDSTVAASFACAAPNLGD